MPTKSSPTAKFSLNYSEFVSANGNNYNRTKLVVNAVSMLFPILRSVKSR
jgi:hypothetical protein